MSTSVRSGRPWVMPSKLQAKGGRKSQGWCGQRRAPSPGGVHPQHHHVAIDDSGRLAPVAPDLRGADAEPGARRPGAAQRGRGGRLGGCVDRFDPDGRGRSAEGLGDPGLGARVRVRGGDPDRVPIQPGRASQPIAQRLGLGDRQQADLELHDQRRRHQHG